MTTEDKNKELEEVLNALHDKILTRHEVTPSVGFNSVTCQRDIDKAIHQIKAKSKSQTLNHLDRLEGEKLDYSKQSFTLLNGVRLEAEGIPLEALNKLRREVEG